MNTANQLPPKEEMLAAEKVVCDAINSLPPNISGVAVVSALVGHAVQAAGILGMSREQFIAAVERCADKLGFQGGIAS
jgi:hypothetical protein